jgi:hypothetical protein
MLQEIHIALAATVAALAAASATGCASPQQCTGFAFDTKVMSDAVINRPAVRCETYAWSSRRLHRRRSSPEARGRKCVVC